MNMETTGTHRGDVTPAEPQDQRLALRRCGGGLRSEGARVLSIQGLRAYERDSNGSETRWNALLRAAKANYKLIKLLQIHSTIMPDVIIENHLMHWNNMRRKYQKTLCLKYSGTGAKGNLM